MMLALMERRALSQRSRDSMKPGLGTRDRGTTGLGKSVKRRSAKNAKDAKEAKKEHSVGSSHVAADLTRP